eukprot:TRINITY_DN11017_c0_g1_i1.p2 TRINITY_DN11017_c0_g1~~TRINITY_DN11017_c0_g1_i1.p2  ORF type:complete len:393 (+),score=90.09 TRINITY_DN11017_c0_g1_i1:295-1473(+)
MSRCFGPMMDWSGTRRRGKMKRYKGLLTALLYGGMSVASVFINKGLFQVYHFHYPYTLVLGQTLFTLVLLLLMRALGVIRLANFQLYVFRRVFLLSFTFLLKLMLDMAALNRVNIPMYGVLKSSTTPFVLLLDYVMRSKLASLPVQLAVFTTTLGGLVAGFGDLTFDMAGYALALGSAVATAAYVVIVGKLGEELQLDSFSLLLYNNCWSLPFSLLFVIVNGEAHALRSFAPHISDPFFVVCFLTSCASAFVLNLATYLCTLVNDSLTTSIVGRTKSILQGVGGLFAFGDVRINPVNLLGLLVNSLGIGWYAYEKYWEARRRQAKSGAGSPLPLSSAAGGNGGNGPTTPMTITRDGSQVALEVHETQPLLPKGQTEGILSPSAGRQRSERPW